MVVDHEEGSLVMKNQKLHQRESELRRRPDNDEVPTPPRDPIEPDPMNPVPQPPLDVEPERGQRPDLDWAEHED
jgi:hypothetical protein